MNYYSRFEGHPFLFENYFLPGKVYCNGKELKQKIRYDIYKDEISIPFGDEILQLNKEAIDSFAVTFENYLFKFIKIDTLYKSGFYNIINLQSSTVLTKFRKDVFPSDKKEDAFEFKESARIYLITRKDTINISDRKDLAKALNIKQSSLKGFAREQKIEINFTRPEKLSPIMEHFSKF